MIATEARAPIGVADLAFEAADQNFNFATIDGVSVWYRLRPEIALGLTGKYLSVTPVTAEASPLRGEEPSPATPLLQDALIGEVFADVRFYPSTFFGWLVCARFAR
jgi:hypothetical protein